ncbi:hypothetical protein [Arenibaculum pallidiluteum]|uniref:hypothetical protein n=1 Tax=Arenibaculum pallidiluteum TaxID=2812559 RepID=UPI001A970900|nr:hypothetical protein [Arenibaculum pallidiluteum]
MLLESEIDQNLRARTWGRAEFVSEDHGDYIVVWEPDAADGDPPVFSIARFKRTGTYAAVKSACVLATAPTVEDVIRALPTPVFQR